MPDTTASINLVSLVDRYHSPEAARDLLEKLRWPDGVDCPRCQGRVISRILKRDQFDCDSCRYQFSVTAGTIFHDSKLPLWKWFLATYIMTESRKGVSANQMKRMLGVSYKTAWYLCHRIRSAMGDASAEMLKGIVEADETYVGGKLRGRHNRKWTANKTMVLGAIQRGGNVRLRTGKVNNRKTLHAFVKSVVDDDAEAIYTDEWWGYKGIGDENTRHETVNHKEDEWVRGDVHTNSVESVWSLFKRSIIGSYHSLSEKHMDAYLDEMAWRFNNRHNEYLFRDTLIKLVNAETLEYKELIAT
ncbi:MAG TPA: IS1595 family transposase [Dehalococcoidia bacterium]|nr:IS1595 family transposase [Dehalococcoidia bacterium]